jgi:hypothetical protein
MKTKKSRVVFVIAAIMFAACGFWMAFLTEYLEGWKDVVSVLVAIVTAVGGVIVVVSLYLKCGQANYLSTLSGALEVVVKKLSPNQKQKFEISTRDRDNINWILLNLEMMHPHNIAEIPKNLISIALNHQIKLIHANSLWFASRNVEDVAALLFNNDQLLNRALPSGETLLHLALKEGNLELSLWLLNQEEIDIKGVEDILTEIEIEPQILSAIFKIDKNFLVSFERSMRGEKAPNDSDPPEESPQESQQQTT